MHFRVYILITLFVTFLTAFGGPGIASTKRVALVIGNSAYEHVSSLPNPANDATDIADALERIGFDVTRGLNLDFRGVRLAIRDFSKTADGADMAVVYFAGHGIEINNTNYLIPVDARLEDDRDIEFEAIRLSSIVSSISNVSGMKIVLADACRNNPFLSQMTRSTATRSIGRGLSRIDPGGVLVGYAAREGTLAMDGEGRNSPYAQALLQHIEEPGLELGRMFRKVRSTVLRLTDGYQEPFTYGSLPDQDIYLVPAAAPRPKSVTPESMPDTPLEIEERIAQAYTVAERYDSAAGWRAFVDKWDDFPNHALVRIAQSRLKEQLDEGEAAWRRAEEREPWITPRKSADGRLEFTREERQLIQQALHYKGIDVGAIDGSFGPRTRSAILQARTGSDLPTGNRIDERLLERLPDPTRIAALISTKARAFKPVEVEGINEPRLEKVVSTLGSQKYVFDYFEGSLYVVVATPTYYQSASDVAKSVGGHLVALNSAAENRFVAGLFDKDEIFHRPDGHVLRGSRLTLGPLIGLVQLDRTNESRGGWIWETGEMVTYQNWLSWSPDNWNQREHNAGFKLDRGISPGNPGAWRWDDQGNQNRSGFIIEIE